MDKAEEDGLFSALKPPGGKREHPPTVQELHALFDTEVILGVWRRTHYAMGAFPMALCGSFSEKSISTASFESMGCAWKFIAATNHRADGDDGPPKHVFARLECAEVGQAPHCLEGDLSLTKTRGGGATWIIEPYKPFRGDPADLPIVVKALDGRYLCSNPKTKRCALVDPCDIDLRDPLGEYVFNVAWECSLMSAQRDDDPSLDFLNQYRNRAAQSTCFTCTSHLGSRLSQITRVCHERLHPLSSRETALKRDGDTPESVEPRKTPDMLELEMNTLLRVEGHL